MQIWYLQVVVSEMNFRKIFYCDSISQLMMFRILFLLQRFQSYHFITFLVQTSLWKHMEYPFKWIGNVSTYLQLFGYGPSGNVETFIPG